LVGTIPSVQNFNLIVKQKGTISGTVRIQ